MLPSGFRANTSVLPSGFEPESKPREGFMIGRYTTGACSGHNKATVIKSFALLDLRMA